MLPYSCGHGGCGINSGSQYKEIALTFELFGSAGLHQWPLPYSGLSLSTSLFLSLYLSTSLFLSLYLSLSLSLAQYLALALSCSFSLSLYLSVSLSISLDLSLDPYLCIFLLVSLS